MRVVVGMLVCGTIDKPAECTDSIGAHQCVAAEGTAVHHTDVERRVQKLIFRQVLWDRGWVRAVVCWQS